MSKTRGGGASGGRPPEVIDAPASGEAVIRLLPPATTRPMRSAEVRQEQRATDGDTVLRVERLSKEIGWLLITAGVVGFVVPGIFGTPFLLAGALVVVPGGPQLLSRWAGRNPPKFVNSAMRQIGRFLDDLERRYPRK